MGKKLLIIIILITIVISISLIMINMAYTNDIEHIGKDTSFENNKNKSESLDSNYSSKLNYFNGTKIHNTILVS
ncbi:MAG: hypothetical protein FWH54_01285 [Methanobrevibacter sp.]|nr:hypothetical protein [Methanobrevibacter sp.]